MDPIDRIAPTRRPAQRAVMKQRWAELLFLHWRVPVEALRPLIPARLSIDTFEGHAYVGLVPFTMTGVRPVWAPPVRPLSNFHETNVRTYVHLEGREPGVWFFSLDAASSVAVRLARALFLLPYYRATMSLTRGADGAIAYASRRLWPAPTPAEIELTYAPTSDVRQAAPGGLEHFLCERYNLYAAGRDNALFRGRVHHTPYPVQDARVDGLRESLLAASGIVRPPEPPLAHYAREVTVDVFGLEKV